MLKAENGTAEFDGNFETIIDDYGTVISAMVEFVKAVLQADDDDDKTSDACKAVIEFTKSVIDNGYTCNGKEVIFDENT